MQKHNVSHININLDYIEKGLQLTIDGKVEDTLLIAADAMENGEAEYQLLEGCSYDYELTNTNFSLEKDNIIQPHSRKKFLGTIAPNIFVGTLSLPVFKEDKFVDNVFLEVISVKADYRDHYRYMLGYITDKCTDLLMQSNSPVSHNFETDFDKDSKTLYQKFAFIQSIIANDEFSESVHRIVSSPVTQWKETEEEKDIRSIKRIKNSNIKELVKVGNRSSIPPLHYMHNFGLDSLPNKITKVRKTDTVDTPENRFVKFVLESLFKFCSDINKKAKTGSRLYRESSLIEKELELYLHHPIFKKISHPETLRLNSPVLQRKEGYREILKVWLMFDLAAKLVWKGGEDVYRGGKKDIATLYEYWLFFKLLDLFKEIFHIEPKDISELIRKTNDDLNLQIKQGEHTALSGIYDTGTRQLNIRFNYNRTFKGEQDYPNAGSWTTNMRPDYTLSIWPKGIPESEAEIQELIVHIHFDAKYKIEGFTDLLSKKNTEDLSREKKENEQGRYKNADLLKMHAYKDAIRRTGGAYILYPGKIPEKRVGFHEIIPGLGAFPIQPSQNNDGIKELKIFILEVLRHFMNRASQREKIAFRSYDIFKNKPLKEDEVNELLPEAYGKNRSMIPDEIYVLVGFCRKENLDWTTKRRLYNARTEGRRGSLRLGPGESGAKYLLLHTDGETKTGRLFEISETGPRIFSKQTLIEKGYPSKPSQTHYLVYKIQEIKENELKNLKWDITLLGNYKKGRGSGLPFSVTLAELMRVKVR